MEIHSVISPSALVSIYSEDLWVYICVCVVVVVGLVFLQEQRQQCCSNLCSSSGGMARICSTQSPSARLNVSAAVVVPGEGWGDDAQWTKFTSCVNTHMDMWGTH